MKDHNQWFLESLAGGMKTEDAQVIAGLILRLQDEEAQKREVRSEDGIRSAMLADIAEMFFGDDCNKENFGHVPRILSYTHAGWACGPGTGKNGSWLRTALILWQGKRGLSEENVSSLEQWEDFLKILKDRVSEGGEG